MPYARCIIFCLVWHATAAQCMLGYPADQPPQPYVGIAACFATQSPQTIVAYTQKLHPDFIELKTIRRYSHSGNHAPLTAPVATPDNFQLCPIHTTTPEVFYPAKRIDDSPHIALANSVGMPSASLPESIEYIRKIQDHLTQHCNKQPQLILSVHGDSILDFESLARAGHELGVSYVCANLSCPNLQSSSIPLYKNPEMVRIILKAMKKKLPATPLIAKIGMFENSELLLMEAVICAIAKAGAQGVYGINAVPINLLNQKNEPYFGENRKQCGLSGAPIRELALSFTGKAKRIIQKHNLNLTLFACGGVTSHEHVQLFAQKGADVVMSATGVMHNPDFSFRPPELRSKL